MIITLIAAVLLSATVSLHAQEEVGDFSISDDQLAALEAALGGFVGDDEASFDTISSDEEITQDERGDDADFPEFPDEGASVADFDDTEPAPQPEPRPTEEIDLIDEAPEGPDTINLEEDAIGTQGNWIKKRRWLEQALDLNGEIQAGISGVQRGRTAFTRTYTTIDKELEEFYQSIGFVRGKAAGVFDDVDRYLKKKKIKDLEEVKRMGEEEDVPPGYFEQRRQEIDDEIEGYGKEIEQLRLDMKALEDLNASLGERLAKVDEVVETTIQEAAKAAKYSDEMWYVIDDKKARARYYQIVAIKEEAAARQSYVESDLLNDFNAVVERARKHMDKIREDIKGFEDRGIILENRSERLAERRRERDRMRREQAAMRKAKREQERAVKAVPAAPTWISTVLYPVTLIFDVIVDGVQSIIEMVMGKAGS